MGRVYISYGYYVVDLRMDYKKNKMNADSEKGNMDYIRARVTTGLRNPKHGKRKHYVVRKPSRGN
jgi:hypothetical protein